MMQSYERCIWPTERLYFDITIANNSVITLISTIYKQMTKNSLINPPFKRIHITQF
jgi:hypothetical protein